ncbi:MAG: hypothetical protein WDN75_10650 [Bacteroidota bacterium]
MKVTFDNTGNSGGSSFDKIIITGLRVLAPASTSGQMFRLGGLAIPSIGDSQTIGTLSSFDAPVIGFTNSYYEGLPSPKPTTVVTSIPDNANPAVITLSPTAANYPTLNPTPPPLIKTLFDLGDYGPSSFSGQGVNINQLTLSAVSLDVPFNVTVTHTDNNGCVSQNAIQYTVYDHTKAINITDALLPGGNTVVSVPLNTYCTDNDNFVVGQTPITPATYGRSGHVRFVDYRNLAPFYLIDLTADLPASGPGQIMSGPAWRAVVQSLPVKLDASQGGTPHVVGADTFYDYKFDDAVIPNASNVATALGAGVIPDPYSDFVGTVTSAANGNTITYYSGGSLGFIELKGNFQSRTNSAVKVPRVQRLEFYLPAIPIVDVSRPSSTDLLDPKNPPYSVSGTGPVHNPGTLVYCEAGGLINITARPIPIANQSTGTFSIVDATSGTPLPPTTGIITNTNGTASIDPSVVTNGYSDIKIIYTYDDQKSPCSSSSYQIIRITPNPVAGFDKNAVISAYTPNNTSFCAGNQINFDANSSAPAVPKTTIAPAPVTTPATNPNIVSVYAWSFGDINSDPVANVSALVAPSHTFRVPTQYTVTLDATSNWGCKAVTYTEMFQVGGIPVVKAKFDGVSTADPFHFMNNGSTVENDTFSSFDWDFDNNGTFDQSGTSVTTSYSTAGPVVFNLKVTSTIGCVNSLSLTNTANGLSAVDDAKLRTLIVLPRANAPSGADGYTADFDTSNGNWQVWYASTPTFPLNFPLLYPQPPIRRCLPGSTEHRMESSLNLIKRVADIGKHSMLPPVSTPVLKDRRCIRQALTCLH